MTFHRGILWSVLAHLAVLATLASCSSGDGDTDADPIRIGFLIPQSEDSGGYGAQIQRGFQLYLDMSEGRLGSHEIEIIVADEGDGGQTALDSVTSLVNDEKIDVLVGTTLPDTWTTIESVLDKSGIPFIGTGGRPAVIDDVSNVWYTSWLSAEPGTALADYLYTEEGSSVYVICGSEQSGSEQILGFTETFLEVGGKLANSGGKVTTVERETTNFTSYINKISSSGAHAVYAGLYGETAVGFVQQYVQSGLDSEIPLYGPGTLTDESVLAEQGEDADGVQTVSDYASDLDNLANREFVVAYQKAYGVVPNVFDVTGHDAALVLDQALAVVGENPTPEAINTAIEDIGQVDSPRGTWRWSMDHSPVQAWYLRQVGLDGRLRANVLIGTLTTLGRSE